MKGKHKIGWVFFALFVLICLCGAYSNGKKTYHIRQGKDDYYTNSIRKSGGCIMFPDGIDGDSTQVCGHYTLIKQH